MGIKQAMNAPKSEMFHNEQIRPGGKATFDADALAIRAQIKPKTSNAGLGGSAGANGHDMESSHPNARNWGRFDSSALHIQHALKATEVQRKYSRPHEKPIESYLVRT